MTTGPAMRVEARRSAETYPGHRKGADPASPHHAPAPAAADPFNRAFLASAAWTKEARHLADVEHRFAMRYRLWDVPATDDKRAQLDRLFSRRDAAIERAEEARHWLRVVWNDASERLALAGPEVCPFFALESRRWPA